MKKLAAKLWAVLMLMLVSMQTMATDTFTSNRTDFRDESIYFMMTTRFYDGDTGNNVLCWDNQSAQIETKDPCWRGDFQGVIDKLDYIKALGFTAIWITPVVQNASGYDYHGYHAMDFQHVDCRYQSSDGSKDGDAMFQELIDKAHAKGIKIILDVVLNHTGNFGEQTLCKEFDRDTDLATQALIDACMIPNEEKLGSDYLTSVAYEQYQRRLALMKNIRGKNQDVHNYWHHYGDFNWDYPNRWWAQIAGDCVDLNTENDYVADYLVKCYGSFIKMGVDGFRIDTSGHISRLTFCKQFIPQFTALGEKYKDKRLNQAPFFMYGEVCARYSDVTYRGQENLSCYYYTWQAPQNLLDKWDGSQSYWDTQVLFDKANGGTGVDDHQMALCESDNAPTPTSDNTFMVNGKWHEPDYSQASGFHVIDFPLHYNFGNAAAAYGLAKSGDKKYNDATYNVVYVDSHDYGPQQTNDQFRFSGDDAQWAENLSLMFTFRGIPCLYYGSEVGFRIDTSGHISRLTFNHQFVPQFAALGKQYENKRLNKAPFFMYGEVCTRGHEATYRGQANLSCYFYTWKSDESLMNQWDGSQSFWDSQVLPEGSGPIGPQALCGKETFGDKKSENAKMINGAWHEPDYSEASGFNVIDFPMHYSYNTAKDAFRLSAEDELYNDATYNVVYIDSHDYSPGPNDLNRFGGTDAQWAENLSLLFTFRGIPCIYYGSEVGFRRGVRIDPGPNGPLSETGRAYFGGYITGDVTATDFGEYKATGNVAASLNHDVAQHLIRLNKIRQAVPALRKGQWTTDGCKATGKNGIAFKRATKDCYALVALNGGATFTDCPAGTYTDVVTGKTYTGSTIEVEAPSTQGQLRVLVKDWKDGKIGEDGAFIYDTTAKSLDGQAYDGNEEVGTIWNEQGPIQPASVLFSQAGGSFRTETINLTVTLSEDAKSGWYQIQGQDKVNLTPGVSENLTIGEGMNFGDTKTIEWSAEAQDGKVKSGSLTFKKVDPNATIMVYVQAENAPFIYAWSKGSSVKKLTGDWPGTKMTESEEINGEKYWTYAFDGVDNFNVILNNNSGAQSGEISGITGDIYLKYDGGANAQKIDAPVNTAAKVTLSPNGGDFEKTVTVTATLSNNAKSGWYKIGNGEQVALTPGKAATFTLGADMMEGES